MNDVFQFEDMEFSKMNMNLVMKKKVILIVGLFSILVSIFSKKLFPSIDDIQANLLNLILGIILGTYSSAFNLL